MNSMPNPVARITIVRQLLIISNIVPSSLILSTLMLEEICSTKTLVLTRATWCHIPEDCILQSNYMFSLGYVVSLTETLVKVALYTDIICLCFGEWVLQQPYHILCK
jgi:hypothetical protein